MYEERHLSGALKCDGNRVESVDKSQQLSKARGRDRNEVAKVSAPAQNLSRARKQDRSNVDKVGASTEAGTQAIPIATVCHETRVSSSILSGAPDGGDGK